MVYSVSMTGRCLKQPSRRSRSGEPTGWNRNSGGPTPDDRRGSGKGPAIGPARLVRVEHEDGGVEVVAIDTREANSLRRIMDSPAVEWTYESAIGMTPIEADVRPGGTAPLTLF